MRASDVGRWASLLLPALAALAASSLLLVDYTRPVPVFCEPGGGCDAVKRTAFAHVAGLPTPAFGVLAFVVLGALTALRGPLARRVQMVLAICAAAVSVLLLGVQARLGQFCPYCVVADLSALALLVAVTLRGRAAWDAPAGALVPTATAGLLTFGMLVPAALALVVKPAVPRPVKEELARTPAGMITVIDYVDFECPWCRRNHKELAPLLAKHAARVRLVRKHVPLGMHFNAINAARACLCGERQGKGDTLAESLFAYPPSDLDAAGCEVLAAKSGLDLEAYRACVKDPEIDRRIAADKAEFVASGAHGLPTVWIGTERLDGASDGPTLAAAFARALRP